MYGAILGDIIGSPYEFDMGDKMKTFPLFSEESCFTDDTVMTVAVAEAFLDAPEDASIIRKRLVDAMQKWGRRYRHAGYGTRFCSWLESRHPQPYNSWGNGSAMRVSPVAWLYPDLETVRQMAHQGGGSHSLGHLPGPDRQHQGADPGLHGNRVWLSPDALLR